MNQLQIGDIAAFGHGHRGFVSMEADISDNTPRGRITNITNNGMLEVAIVGLYDLPTGEVKLVDPNQMSLHRGWYDLSGWWW